MDSRLLRRTLRGAVLMGGLFGGVALLQALRSGAPFPGVLQPLLLFTVLGATVGGLAGPLVGAAVSRLRGPGAEPEGGRSPDGRGANGGREASPGR